MGMLLRARDSLRFYKSLTSAQKDRLTFPMESYDQYLAARVKNICLKKHSSHVETVCLHSTRQFHVFLVCGNRKSTF